ncbi:MAG: RNA polymerase sigma factor [Chloroflexi bacterium]|nr:RNA polymerase sigma factor [Chloroflexota bacterium]
MGENDCEGSASVDPSGDPERCFSWLYEVHHRAIYAYLFGRTGNRETALDLLQDTFVRVWCNLSQICNVAPHRQRAWIFAVARNLVTDAYRRNAAQAAAYQAFAQHAEWEVDPRDEPAMRLEEEEQLQMLDRAIRRLPEEHRTVLLLQALGGLSSAEIGELLGRPAGTVRYQLARARRQLAATVRLI